jgi:hypothetical protein
MKRGTQGNSKFRALARRLDVRDYVVVGLLECLWHLCARETPCGDLGRLPNHRIAMGIDWEGDPDDLVDALTECGWLDESEEYRLVVHDWHEHADETLRKQLLRTARAFVTGPIRPKVSDNGGQRRTTADNGGQRLPLADSGSRCPPHARPLPEPEPCQSHDDDEYGVRESAAPEPTGEGSSSSLPAAPAGNSSPAGAAPTPGAPEPPPGVQLKMPPHRQRAAELYHEGGKQAVSAWYGGLLDGEGFERWKDELEHHLETGRGVTVAELLATAEETKRRWAAKGSQGPRTMPWFYNTLRDRLNPPPPASVTHPAPEPDEADDFAAPAGAPPPPVRQKIVSRGIPAAVSETDRLLAAGPGSPEWEAQPAVMRQALRRRWETLRAASTGGRP